MTEQERAGEREQGEDELELEAETLKDLEASEEDSQDVRGGTTRRKAAGEPAMYC